MTANHKRWTVEEEEVLSRYMRANPTNLAKNFIIVADQIGRTEKAVAAHWYSSMSKRPNAEWYFGIVSRHSVSKNRKNSVGINIKPNIWQRFLNLFKSL